MNKPNQAIRYFEELMRSPRSSSNISGLGHTKQHSSTKEGESSKSGELSNTKSKVNLHAIIVVKLKILQTFAEARMVCKILNLSLLVIVFITRSKGIK